ncbi:MAG: AP2 domain-containing protein [Treponemataceae bacterium]|nr:MAG: AP2 domain-containing protein [Treponemataceae bacterium]
MYKCRCKCGNEKIAVGYKLRNGEVKSCGCLRLEEAIKSKAIYFDVDGKKKYLNELAKEYKIGVSTIKHRLNLGLSIQEALQKTSKENKYKGAYFDKRRKKYNASISVNKKSIHLGCFNTAEEAHAAYLEAYKKYRGEHRDV